MNNLIGIHGRIGSGKDLLGKILQVLADAPASFDRYDVITEEMVNYKVFDIPKYRIVKFADKLKDIICVLLGCTREQLEDRIFKEKELGEEWWKWVDDITSVPYLGGDTKMLDSYNTKLQKTTPRLLLQLMGTECGREIIHPDLWVISTFTAYTRKLIMGVKTFKEEPLAEKAYTTEEGAYPNWIITDMRFPNELEAIKSRGGISIRINRYNEQVLMDKGIHIPKHLKTKPHKSEIALDNAKFDYVYENTGSIKDLVEFAKTIMLKRIQ